MREAVREARADALARAVAAAGAAGADAIVVPGNVWAADTVSVPKIQRLLDALAAFAPSPVYLAPGPLDAPGRLPFGERSFRAALSLGEWPPNVHLFPSGAWSTFTLPGRADVAFVGRAHAGAALPEPPPAPAPLSILVASAPEREPALPDGWAWCALGGRAGGTLPGAGGAPRGAYAGSPAADAFGAPPPSFLVVRLAPGEAPRVESVPSGGLRFFDIVVDVGGLEETAALERAARRIEESGAGSSDAVRLTLEGTPAPTARLAVSSLGARVRHLAVRDRTERPSPGETGATAEARFAAEMRSRRDAATAPAAARAAQVALELGRAALAGRPLAPPAREDA